MCISVDELTTKQLEDEIAALYRWAEQQRFSESNRHRFLARARNMEEALKERAEKGTI